MAEQLSIFGLWERVVAPPEEEPPPPPPPPPPAPVDPRQVDLLTGAQPLRAVLEEACVALDAPAVRLAREALFSRFLGQDWAGRALDWADAIEWLVGRAGETLDAQAQVERALALEGADAELRFPEAAKWLLVEVRRAALGRAVERLVAEQGPGARLDDGRPAGVLLLLAGDAERAHPVLTAACAELREQDARWLGYLGEAAWRSGQHHGALAAYCHACLVDPTAIDEALLTCAPVLDLVDLGVDLELEAPVLAYVPVLADLQAVLMLDDLALATPPGAAAPRRLAALLRAYRSARAAGTLDEAGRLAVKRELLRLAPVGLKELLRRI